MADSNLIGTSPLSFKAGATVNINRFVKLNTTAGEVIQGAAGTDIVIGVAALGGAAADNIPVQMAGKAKVTAGAAVALNAQVTSDATGRAVTVATGNTAAGLALQAAGAAGDVIEVLLATPNVPGPVVP